MMAWIKLVNKMSRKRQAAQLRQRRRRMRRHFPYVAGLQMNKLLGSQTTAFFDRTPYITVYIVCPIQTKKWFLKRRHTKTYLFKELANQITARHAIFLSRSKAQQCSRFQSHPTHVIKANVPEHTIIGLSEKLYLNGYRLRSQDIQGCYLGKKHGNIYAANPEFLRSNRNQS